MGPGKEQFNLIYDMSGAQLWNMDWTFTYELLSIVASKFPGRMERMVVINSGWIDSTLWKGICPLLDAASKEKITFCGQDFAQTLLEIVENSHPYLCYALEVQGGARAPTLPKASPYLPRWPEVIAADPSDPPATKSIDIKPQAVEMVKSSVGKSQEASAITGQQTSSVLNQIAGFLALQCGQFCGCLLPGIP